MDIEKVKQHAIKVRGYLGDILGNDILLDCNDVDLLSSEVLSLCAELEELQKMCDGQIPPNARGMYRETPRVFIGEYSISSDMPGTVWIEHESGEGAQFSVGKLGEVIHTFYKKHF